MKQPRKEVLATVLAITFALSVKSAQAGDGPVTGGGGTAAVKAYRLECQQKAKSGWGRVKDGKIINWAEGEGIDPTRCGVKLAATEPLMADISLQFQRIDDDSPPKQTSKQRITISAKDGKWFFLDVPKDVWPGAGQVKIALLVEGLDGKRLAMLELLLTVEFVDAG
jgi:hypothetical protein